MTSDVLLTWITGALSAFKSTFYSLWAQGRTFRHRLLSIRCMETPHPTLPDGAIDASWLRLFFINHLNRVFCAKTHLQERLPEIRAQAYFTDLVDAITEILTDVEKQVSRMRVIFSLLDSKPGFGNCQGLVDLIEDASNAIHHEFEPKLRDLSILFYLQSIESIAVASFNMLRVAAPQLGNAEISQWLKESYDEAQDDLELLGCITTYYFKM